MKNFNEALDAAKKLPTHNEAGELNPIYQPFENMGGVSFRCVESDDILTLHEAFKQRRNGATRYYTTLSMTYRENGSIRQKSEWKRELWFHKAWSRTDKKVVSVTYDIIGLKRESSKLPAMVMVSNVNFVTE